MIRSFKTRDVVHIQNIIKSNPQMMMVFSSKVALRTDATFECYVCEEGEGISGVLLLHGSRAYVALGTGSSLMEIALFLDMNPNIKEVCGTADSIDWIAPILTFPHQEKYEIAKLSGEPVKAGADSARIYGIFSIVELRKAYALLSDMGMINGISFDEYYMNKREAIIEKKSRVFIAEVEGKAVSTASTLYEIYPSAFLGGVATSPEFRNRGLATAVVGALCKKLKEDGFSSIYIAYSTPEAAAVYKNIGFSPVALCRRLYKPEEETA